MKHFLLLFILISTFKSTKADYDSKIIADMIKTADLIAECRIIKVFDGEFEIELIEVLKGSKVPSKIKVQRFFDWTCAQRYSNYKIGQVELIFLTKNQYTNTWHALGAGNEGEMPIAEGCVYYKSIYMAIDNDPKILSFQTGMIYGYAFEISDTKQAILKYMLDNSLIEKLIQKKQIKNYKTKNPFLSRIINELQEKNYR